MNSDETFTEKPHIAQPYDALAPIYDELMLHVEYDLWADYIHRIFQTFGGEIREVLELACGTGTFAAQLQKHGYLIQGYDRSPAMIEVARKRRENEKIRFAVGSFLDFPLKSRFDAALCLYDSINYLLKLEDVVEFLRRVKEALKPGGLFVFDICTRYNSRKYFRHYQDTGVIKGYRYYRYSDYNPRTHYHSNEFQLFEVSNPTLRFGESHRQRIYSLGEIRNAVQQAGMILLEELSDMTFRKVNSRSLRVHIITKAP